jgi:hypothetical protein
MKNYVGALTNLFRHVDEMINSMRGEEELKAIRKELNSTACCKN